MTLQGAMDELIGAFTQAGIENPQFEVRQLVQECLGLTLAQLMSQPDRELEEASLSRLRQWGERRVSGVPLAYLSGHRGFYKYDFITEPGVLVPRPETELVVETVLRRAEDRASNYTLADLGCGTGCIGLSLLSEMADLRLWAADVSAKACELTLKNAALLGVEERVKVENVRVEAWDPGMHFDLIVANPPYIPEGDSRVSPSVRLYEPPEALFSGEDGLDAMRSWCAWAFQRLSLNGIFVAEFGAGQSRVVEDLLGKTGFQHLQTERDLSGHDRVISGIRTR